MHFDTRDIDCDIPYSSNLNLYTCLVYAKPLSECTKGVASGYALWAFSSVWSASNASFLSEISKDNFYWLNS